MRADRFDALARSLATRLTRRAAATIIAGATLGGALALTALEDSAAKRRRRCRPCRKKKNGKCRRKKRNGARCRDGGVCQNGKCIAPPCNPPCFPPATCVGGTCVTPCETPCAAPPACPDGACCPDEQVCGAVCCGQGRRCEGGACRAVLTLSPGACSASNDFCARIPARCLEMPDCECFMTVEGYPICGNVADFSGCPATNECATSADCGSETSFCVALPCCPQGKATCRPLCVTA